MKTSKLLAILLAATLFVVGATSRAGPVTIMLNNGVNPAVVVEDEGVGDEASGMAGIVTFIGGIGAWFANVTTGIGAPIFSDPHLDLSSVNISSSVGGTFIDLYVSQTDFKLSDLAQLFNFAGSIGGTTAGTVFWELLVDSNNMLFAGVQVVDGTGVPNAQGAFSGSGVDSSVVDGLFSMTLHVRVTHGNGFGITSFDFEGFAVPEPTTLLLLGAALLGLALTRRRP